MAVTASFIGGILTTFGDALNNTTTLSRNAAGTILVNGGAIPVKFGTPTIVNTKLMQVFGLSATHVTALLLTYGAAGFFGCACQEFRASFSKFILWNIR